MLSDGRIGVVMGPRLRGENGVVLVGFGFGIVLAWE